ncbi:MAG TPA: hypothetical protein VFH78_08555 [Candidatus Thermoplasmatota archaeon]|nr:hypothetical protein [Candidatus Thermoplasmatota archaeon]
MPIDRATLEEFVARVNATRPADKPVRIESFDPPGRFVLSYPDRPMPEGQCIDQDFTDIQFALFEARELSTNLVGGAKDEDAGRYVMTYEVVEWD